MKRRKRKNFWTCLTEGMEFGAIIGISFAVIVAFIQRDTATAYSALACLLILAHHIWEKNKDEE